jgi:hypothetical protein
MRSAHEYQVAGSLGAEHCRREAGGAFSDYDGYRTFA